MRKLMMCVPGRKNNLRAIRGIFRSELYHVARRQRKRRFERRRVCTIIPRRKVDYARNSKPRDFVGVGC